jgi:hypothetical protein
MKQSECRLNRAAAPSIFPPPNAFSGPVSGYFPLNPYRSLRFYSGVWLSENGLPVSVFHEQKLDFLLRCTPWQNQALSLLH